MATLVIEMESDGAMKYSTFYANSKAKTVVREIDIDNVFKLIYTAIILNI